MARVAVIKRIAVRHILYKEFVHKAGTCRRKANGWNCFSLRGIRLLLG